MFSLSLVASSSFVWCNIDRHTKAKVRVRAVILLLGGLCGNVCAKLQWMSALMVLLTGFVRAFFFGLYALRRFWLLLWACVVCLQSTFSCDVTILQNEMAFGPSQACLYINQTIRWSEAFAGMRLCIDKRDRMLKTPELLRKRRLSARPHEHTEWKYAPCVCGMVARGNQTVYLTPCWP